MADSRAGLPQLIYRATMSAALPLLLPLLAFHPRLRGGLANRFGWRLPPASVGRPVWLHGSSAGDMVALAPVAQRIGQAGHPLVATAWTRAGHQMADRRLGGATRVLRAPLDFEGPVQRALDRLQPRLLLLECLEIWPCLISACHRRGVPVIVVNGRLSAASLRRYHALDALFGLCFSGLSMVIALTEEDALRFEAAGVAAHRIFVAPTSKHAGLSLGSAERSPARKLVLGSLHRQEERKLLPWIKRLLEEVADLQVVIAPRYPHRAAAVERHLTRLGLTSVRSSQGRGAGRQGAVVVDQMGVLAAEYRDARAAFVGGSLIPRGGHNVLEAAAAGVPVLFGPHTANCRQEAEQLLALDGGVMVSSGVDFYQRALRFLCDEEAFSQASVAALSAAQQITDASGRGIRWIMEFIAGCGDPHA